MLVYRYEALFYSALALVLLAWIVVEAVLMNATVITDNYDFSLDTVTFDLSVPSPSKGNRALKLADMRVPLCFVSSSGVSLTYGIPMHFYHHLFPT